MAGQTEVRESHEQFSLAWALDARAGGVGEVVDMEGIRVANARSLRYLMNAALLTGPVSSPAELAANASAAMAYFGVFSRWMAGACQSSDEAVLSAKKTAKVEASRSVLTRTQPPARHGRRRADETIRLVHPAASTPPRPLSPPLPSCRPGLPGRAAASPWRSARRLGRCAASSPHGFEFAGS